MDFKYKVLLNLVFVNSCEYVAFIMVVAGETNGTGEFSLFVVFEELRFEVFVQGECVYYEIRANFKNEFGVVALCDFRCRFRIENIVVYSRLVRYVRIVNDVNEPEVLENVRIGPSAAHLGSALKVLGFGVY